MAVRHANRAKAAFFCRNSSTANTNGTKLASFTRTNIVGLCLRQAAMIGFCSIAFPLRTKNSVEIMSAKQIATSMRLSALTLDFIGLFLPPDLRKI